jgi:hypothetical protein
MKKTALIALSLAGLAAVTTAQELNATATFVRSYDVGVPDNGPWQRVGGPGYSNKTNFTGFGAANGGATVTTTGTVAVMDDLNFDAGSGAVGQNLGILYFSVFNGDATTDINARVRVRFFDTTGTGGGPGVNTLAVSFNPITFTHGQVTVFSSDFSTFNFVLPSSMWAAEFFDGASGATATVAQLNELGQGLFNPPTVGTSQDRDFVTTAAGAPGSNPAGTIRTSPFGGNPAANYGWEFNPVPEPASMAVLGIGALALIRRRRSRKA